MLNVITDFFGMVFGFLSAWVQDDLGLLTALVSVFCFVIFPFRSILHFK